MDKFCNVCGNVIPQGSNVCPVCGTPVQPQPMQVPPMQIQQKKKSKVLPVVIGVIALVLAIGIVCFVAFGLLSGSKDDKDSDNGGDTTVSDEKTGDKTDVDDDIPVVEKNSPDGVVNSYVEAMLVDFDAEALLDLQHEKTIDYLGRQSGLSTREEYIEYVEENMMTQLRDGAQENNGTVEWEITGHKSVSSSSQKQIKEFFDTEMGLEVTDFEKVEFTITPYEDGVKMEDESKDCTMTVVKIDGVWYMYLVEGLFT